LAAAFAAGIFSPTCSHAALPAKDAEATIAAMPPAGDTLIASHAYAATVFASTNHAGWTSSSAYVNVPQTVRLSWHVDTGGEVILRARDAWDARAPWRDVDRWGQSSGKKQRGETEVTVDRPTLFWLRVRAPRFPRSGVASLRADYVRHTIAVLHGAPAAPGQPKRPVVLAEGYDPFNDFDWNDPSWQANPALARLAARAREKYRLEPWILDWGDGGAPLEQQGEDFAEIARQLRERTGGPPATVAVGVSMGAVSLRYALAKYGGAALGVRKYVSVNGPHQGAWVNPDLREFLLKRALRSREEEPAESSEAFLIRRGLDNPAARELIIGAERHDAFYSALRALGDHGYDPALPRVAFSSGSLVNEGTDLAELASGKRQVVHRISVRPLWLPLWVTLHRSYQEFRYGEYPGELLMSQLAQPVREHIRLFGIFRFDFRAQWESLPTFIPTHSALDFPDDLAGGPDRFRYARWRDTVFNRIYLSRDRNRTHDDTRVDWIDPRTGKGAPGDESAVLWEIARTDA